jgi:hypothetical protein
MSTGPARLDPTDPTDPAVVALRLAELIEVLEGIEWAAVPRIETAEAAAWCARLREACDAARDQAEERAANGAATGGDTPRRSEPADFGGGESTGVQDL